MSVLYQSYELNRENSAVFCKFYIDSNRVAHLVHIHLYLHILPPLAYMTFLYTHSLSLTATINDTIYGTLHPVSLFTTISMSLPSQAEIKLFVRQKRRIKCL